MRTFSTLMLFFTFMVSTVGASQEELVKKPLVCMVEDRQADINESILGRLFFKTERKVADDEALALQQALIQQKLPLQFKYHKHRGGYVICVVSRAFGDYEAFSKAASVEGRLLNHSVPLLTGIQMESEPIPDYDIGLIFKDEKDEKHYFWLTMVLNVYVKDGSK